MPSLYIDFVRDYRGDIPLIPQVWILCLNLIIRGIRIKVLIDDVEMSINESRPGSGQHFFYWLIKNQLLLFAGEILLRMEGDDALIQTRILSDEGMEQLCRIDLEFALLFL